MKSCILQQKKMYFCSVKQWLVPGGSPLASLSPPPLLILKPPAIAGGLLFLNV